MFRGKDKRSQAAIEFLMTYGWALLIVFILIGALWYFGFLDPSAMIPEKCTVPILRCKDFLFVKETFDEFEWLNINLSLENNAGHSITMNRVDIEGESLSTECYRESPRVIANGETGEFQIPGGINACNYIDTGKSKNDYSIIINYSWTDNPNKTHIMQGKVFARSE